jgi:2'-5' RNA ligase
MAPGGRLHLTLRFLGSLAPGDLAPLTAACSKIAAPDFRLEIRGLGVFQPGRARRRGRAAAKAVLWAGLAPSPGLWALKEAVDSALQASLGLAPERRFQPHLTLARFPAGDEAVAKLVASSRDFAAPSFMARELRLYRSELGPSMAVHSLLAAWPLGPAGGF